jgi:hypothetical protein
MKHIAKLFVISLVVLSAGGLLAQNNAATTVTPYSLIEGVSADLSVNCVNGMKYDDNTWENGYGWNPGFGWGRWVMMMTPPSYPYTINQICVALTRNAGATSWTFNLVVFAGAPGTPTDSLWGTTVTANNVPTWPSVGWFDFPNLTGIPPITSGSVYVGISYDPVTQTGKFIGADESTTTPLRTGYGYIQNTWTLIQTYFSTYRAIGVRAENVATYAHDYAAGPFLSLPTSFSVGTPAVIKAKISNFGTSNETGVPIRFYVGGVLNNQTTLSLNSGAVDSVTFNWTPSAPGVTEIKVISDLATDQNRVNDTVKTNVNVYPPGTQQNCNSGTGTTAVGWPYYTFYMDSRCDMLYLAADLGNIGNRYILTIGFNVVSAAPQLMNGFKIKMQNTTMTSLTGFTSTGWTTVYDGTYSVPGTGWQFVTLQNPFLYNGTNLLVEICFNNSSYTSNTTVQATSMPGRTWHQYADLPSGDGCVDLTAGTSQANLPNFCFLNVVGVENKNNEIPNVFSLSQNYPNPFNPTTSINFAVPKPTVVKLTVFDILGKEVATLVNEFLQPGNYNFGFDASSLSSGMYFYKMEAGEFTDTKKMMLIK